MIVKDKRKGIEVCLSNGKRLFDAASKLEANKKYVTSIPLYILAFEEFGKAKFLRAKLFDCKDVTVAEFEKLTNSKSAHIKKILYDPIEYQQFLKFEPEQFYAHKKFSEYVGLPFTKLDPKHALELSKQTMRIFGKLHDLKMAMLYVGYDHDWQTPKRFHEKSLADVCYYLHYEVIRSYHNVKFDLALYDSQLGANATNLTEDQRVKISKNEDKQALFELDKIYRSTRFYQCLTVTQSVLSSL